MRPKTNSELIERAMDRYFQKHDKGADQPNMSDSGVGQVVGRNGVLMVSLRNVNGTLARYIFYGRSNRLVEVKDNVEPTYLATLAEWQSP